LVNRRWLFVVDDDVTTPLVVKLKRAERTLAGDALGLLCR
jgi:hypothetical protein